MYRTYTRIYTRARRDRCAQSKRKRKIIYYKRLFSARARRVLHFYKFQNLYYAYIFRTIIAGIRPTAKRFCVCVCVYIYR